MRKFTLLLCMLAAALTISAVPARPNQWRTLTLADGTTVQARLVGDEYAHWFVDANGSTYARTANGLYARTDAQTRMRKGAQRRSQAATHFAGRRKVAISGNRGDFKGTKKGLIILVNFSDLKFGATHTQALYQKIANSENYSEGDFTGSIKDYFSAQSDGRFTIDFDVVGPVTVSKGYAYYGANDENDNDQHPEEMIMEACRLADSQVDFSKYDWTGNGEVDQVYVVYAGQGEANGGSEDTIWPHAFSLTECNKSLTLDGVKIDSYACSAELGDKKIDGIGTICHEFSHCLGYPDLYDVFYEGNFGMLSFDLMCSGSYNNNGFTPAGYTAYEKWIAGWLDYEELADEDVTVTNLKPTSEGGKAYAIYNKGNRNEYFLLENRQLTGWDKYLEASGLQVIHIDYDVNCWANNVVNAMGEFTTEYGWTANFTNDHQRHTLVHADNDDDSGHWNKRRGAYNYTTCEGDLYPYEGNNALSDYTTPGFGLYNKNADGTKNMGCEIKDITTNADGTVSFQYNAKVKVDPTPEGQVLYESFDKCAGTGGNDDKWSGNGVASKSLTPDLTDWSYDSGNGANKCAKFGSSSKAGTVSSPQFQLVGTATVTFKAAPWGTDGRTLKLLYNGNVVGTYTLEPNQWTDITATITGVGQGRLTFQPTKRFFLDEVRVVAQGGTDGIELPSTPATRPADNRIYTLQGQYAGTSLSSLPSGVYIVGGRKVVK